MFRFVLGVIVLFAAFVLPFIAPSEIRRGAKAMISSILAILGAIFIIFSTSLKVDSNEGGLITKMFGTGLDDGRIVAVNGERGVQADVLTPGWSFGWWPWLYKLESVPNIEIKDGQVGVVTARMAKARRRCSMPRRS